MNTHRSLHHTFRKRELTLNDAWAGQDVDVLLVQPPLTMRINECDQDPVVRKFFQVMSSGDHTLLGDDPYEPNNAILQIAADLRACGLSVAYLDFHSIDLAYRRANCGAPLPESEMQSILYRYKYKALAISVMTIAAPFAKKVFTWHKQHIPAAQVFLGGLFASAMPQYFTDVDATVVESGADPSAVIARYFGRVAHYGSTSRAFDLLLKEQTLVPRVTTTYGCSHKCSFCSPVRANIPDQRSLDPKVRVQQLMGEIQALRQAYDPEFLVLGSLSFFSSEVDEMLLIELAKSERPLPFWCQVRPDVLTRTRLQLLKEAGCVQVAVGIESLSNAALKKSAKGYRLVRDEAGTDSWPYPYLKMIQDAELSAYGYFVIGLPGETVEDTQRTSVVIRELLQSSLLDAVHISVPVPYPGTPWFARPASFGIRILHDRFEEFWMNCDPLGYGRPVIETRLLDAGGIYDSWLSALAEATIAIETRKSGKLCRMFNVS